MGLLIYNSEDKISLDEIIHSLSTAYENKAFAELLKLILSMIQEIIIGRILSKSADAPACWSRASVAKRALRQTHQDKPW